jgi:hypothetical protein
LCLLVCNRARVEVDASASTCASQLSQGRDNKRRQSAYLQFATRCLCHTTHGTGSTCLVVGHSAIGGDRTWRAASCSLMLSIFICSSSCSKRSEAGNMVGPLLVSISTSARILLPSLLTPSCGIPDNAPPLLKASGKESIFHESMHSTLYPGSSC